MLGWAEVDLLIGSMSLDEVCSTHITIINRYSFHGFFMSGNAVTRYSSYFTDRTTSYCVTIRYIYILGHSSTHPDIT